ncbi:MAG: cytochrome c biogenesis protein CcsA [Euryarchaeota archaeon]|nr:cytochrome c biogenesis protein CcsA [Euryarchaeota archaeon]
MSVGDALLALSLLSGGAAALALLLSLERVRRPALLLFASSLTLAFLLLLYYFAVSDFRLYYVWRFSSSAYPIYYKLSGSLAGQEGTLLFWAMLIALSALWLERGEERRLAFVKHTQLVVVVLGLYFTFLTFLQSPFTTIYEAFPDVPPGFVPEDGNGLNPLLLDPWMASHPVTTFLGYAGTTIPFAGAVVYLFITALRRGEDREAQRLWVTKGMQWLRFAWLFSTVSMAFGGIWAYKTLGWGGFWAWDPVETAMLLPWLMLTAAVHVTLEHRRDSTKYNVLAPVLVALSFSLVVYATAVTRSGIFESVHAFIAGSVGKYIMLLVGISFAVPLALGLWKYTRVPRREEGDRVVSRTNIFYAAILVFLIVIFISFYGITFPPLMKLITTQKYAITKQFFNLWLYPFFLLMLLLIALGLHYTERRKAEAMRAFAGFALLTLVAVFIKPTEDFNIVDYTSFISASKPLLYATIGEVSSLSVIPPVAYILYASAERWRLFSKAPRRRKLREAGVIAIHIGVALIAIGVVFSSLFTSEFSVTLNKNRIGEEKPLAQAVFHEGFGRLGTWGVHQGEVLTEYRIKLLDFRDYIDYGSGGGGGLGMSIGEFRRAVQEAPEAEYSVKGVVAQVLQGGHAAFVKLSDESGELWIATAPGVELSAGRVVVATGMPLLGVKTPQGTVDVVLLAEQISENPINAFRRVQLARVAVYRGEAKLGEGDVKFEVYKNGDARRPLIDRSFLRDVFVVMDSPTYQGEMSMTVRIKPLINQVWMGVVLFVVGIVLCIIYDTRGRGDEA